jgi:hypothetical protein
MKKIIFCLIIFVSVSTFAYAIDGTMDIAWIEQGGTPNPGGGVDVPFCGAWDRDDTGFSMGNNTGNPCSTVSAISVVKEENKVTAICKFTDEAYSLTPKAQLWHVVNCNLISGIATLQGGTGTIIRARRTEFDPEAGQYIGGTALIKCVFELPPDPNCPP